MPRWFVFRQLARADPQLVGGDRNRGAVHIGSGDHQHVVANHAVVAGEDVGRHIRPGGVSQVTGTAGIRPRDTDQDVLRLSSLRVIGC